MNTQPLNPSSTLTAIPHIVSTLTYHDSPVHAYTLHNSPNKTTLITVRKVCSG